MAETLNPDPLASPLALAESADFLDEQYQRWREDPSAVGPEWQFFFQGFELAMCPRPCVAAEQAAKQSKVASLIFAYRSQGHLIAQLDPLGNNLATHPDLELERFGLEEGDLDQVFDTGHLGGPRRATLRELIGILRETYCRTVGVEYLHIQDFRMRRWLQGQMEPTRNRAPLTPEGRREILQLLTDAELFETFLQDRYPGHKRFSLEGAESLIPACHALVELAPELGFSDIVIGMTHRGRLNVLANILDKPAAMIFSEFEDNYLPEIAGGSSDVKYHLGYHSDHVDHLGRAVHLDLTANPSHLEAVGPVVQGRARGKQRRRGDTELRRQVLPFLIHGDAAFAGQGLVAETLNLSQLPGYRTGGTLHFVVNNQIGFTTLPPEGRSSLYSTDVAKMIEAPIFHVNGDDPEAVVHAVELALTFRQKFGRDVLVDMICYRRHGHSEGDEPAFTQPLLYKRIQERPSVRRLYAGQLAAAGESSGEAMEALAQASRERLQQAWEAAKRGAVDAEPHAFGGRWAGFGHPYSHEPVETGAGREALREVTRALTTVPEGFRLNPKVVRRLAAQRQAVEEERGVDWALAELLAFGTLLREGIPVRLSGQDSARGTFSQRHAAWQDMETQESWKPLNQIGPGQAKFCVYNSSLAEASVLGFDYGYSLTDPNLLVLWEAQFGDFANGAQVIIDQFIVAALSKWQRASGLVMLLPHGYEGQGPEHSSAYLERYLQACAEENIEVCQPTTPAQYFHLLRRQIKRPFRRPLIVMTPKSLLRHPLVVSPPSELAAGRFREIIEDPRAPSDPRQLILCSGKVYYDLLEARDRQPQADGSALVRIEQFYPWPEAALAELAARCAGVPEIVWAQEEPQNRGGWTFVFPRLLELFPGRRPRYAGRPASASPAGGSLRRHRLEQEELLRDALRLPATAPRQPALAPLGEPAPPAGRVQPAADRPPAPGKRTKNRKGAARP